MACGAGWDSASLPTISSTLDAGWAPHNPPKSEALLHQGIVQWKTTKLDRAEPIHSPRVRISFLRKHHFAPESSLSLAPLRKIELRVAPQFSGNCSLMRLSSPNTHQW